MGRRVDGSGKAIDHVDQYLPYLSDGLLALLVTCLLGSMLTLGIASFRRPPEPPKLQL